MSNQRLEARLKKKGEENRELETLFKFLFEAHTQQAMHLAWQHQRIEALERELRTPAGLSLAPAQVSPDEGG
jgi:hypothetical protein